jgi:hypothetical protein
MLGRIFPKTIDNEYRGQKAALWLLGLLLFFRTAQSLMIIFNTHKVATQADGIPLDTYPTAAAQTILAFFAASGLLRLLISLLGVLILVRYRKAVPFMFAFLSLSSILGQILLYFVPLVRVGNPVAATVNNWTVVLMLAGLALSMMQRKRALPGAS